MLCSDGVENAIKNYFFVFAMLSYPYIYMCYHSISCLFETKKCLLYNVHNCMVTAQLLGTVRGGSGLFTFTLVYFKKAKSTQVNMSP